MAEGALEDVLQMVADGLITVDEAAPILDVLERRSGSDDTDPPRDDSTRRSHAGASKASSDDAPARAIRIEISEGGRKVVNLRVPLALGKAAIDNIPGLTESMTDRIRQALSSGLKGPIVQVDDDGAGVRIAIE